VAVAVAVPALMLKQLNNNLQECFLRFQIILLPVKRGIFRLEVKMDLADGIYSTPSQLKV
jgi:hypothetical protein